MMRSEAEQQKRRIRRYDGEIYGEIVRTHNAAFRALPARPYPIPGRFVALRGALDLVSNTDETLTQVTELDRVEVPPLRRTRVMIDLAKVDVLEPAALLFLCSRIADLGDRPFVDVTGTYPPKDSQALRMLRDAKFDSFLKGAPIPTIHAARTLSLIDGTTAGHRTVSPQTAAAIHTFLHGLHPKLTIEELDALALAVTECLENVRVHAYRTKEERRKGWFVVGRYDELRATSSVAILDMGIGIAATVRDHFAWKGRLKSDADLVEAATTGRVTATQEPNRGKGYGFLRTFVTAKEGRRLHVLSSSTMLTFGKDAKAGILAKRPTAPFTGTIVCLQITNR